jgi:hypothetical protein
MKMEQPIKVMNKEEKTLVADSDEVLTIDKYYSTKFPGHYQLGGSEGVQIYLVKKPKWLHRKMMKLCFGLKWINN